MLPLREFSFRVFGFFLGWITLWACIVFGLQRDATEHLEEIQGHLKTLRMLEPQDPTRTRFEFSFEKTPGIIFTLRGVAATDQLLLGTQERTGFSATTWVASEEWRALGKAGSIRALGFRTRNATY